jgi:hypothetical protein
MLSNRVPLGPSRPQVQDVKFSPRFTEKTRDQPKPSRIFQTNETIFKPQRPILAFTYETGLANRLTRFFLCSHGLRVR